MDDKELIKKKDCGECICDGCERRFVCWTTKRVFSEPTHQALYEAYIAEGLPHDEAIKEVGETLEHAVLQAELRKLNNDKKVPDWNDKKKGWYDEWHDNLIPPKVKWDSDIDQRAIPDWKGSEIEFAKKDMKDLQKYFRSMISGKSTNR